VRSFERDEPVMAASVSVPRYSERQEIYGAIHEVKAMLNEARIALPSDFKLEISHHYGMANFRGFGAVLIECVNRSYCKKLIVQLARQEHPCHYHKRKEETFQVLHGVLEVELDDRRKTLRPGDTLLVQPGVWHRFWTETGVVFEEISTTHFDNDSFYEDKAINRLERSARKTVVEHWGRHQI
jgi:N-acetylneuraminate synthase